MFNDEQFDCEHSRVTATTKDMIEVLHLGVYYNSTSVCIVKHLYTTIIFVDGYMLLISPSLRKWYILFAGV